jgi:protein gp37
MVSIASPDHSTLYTCFTSDFLVEEADAWRTEVWAMMRARPGVQFIFFTKRIERLKACLPADWGDGYPNVTIGCTVENQRRADERLPVFLSLPIQTRWIIAEPLLGAMDLSKASGFTHSSRCGRWRKRTTSARMRLHLGACAERTGRQRSDPVSLSPNRG